MSIETIKQTLVGYTSEPGVKANAAFHLLMVLEQYESGMMSRMEALTKIKKCKKSHMPVDSTVRREVTKICVDILQNI